MRALGCAAKGFETVVEGCGFVRDAVVGTWGGVALGFGRCGFHGLVIWVFEVVEEDVSKPFTVKLILALVAKGVVFWNGFATFRASGRRVKGVDFLVGRLGEGCCSHAGVCLEQGSQRACGSTMTINSTRTDCR